jgi:16S rRNA (uracil1498-N3)-methyltransferase
VRIFVSPLVVGDIVVRGDEHHYVGRVRRARAGDEIELVDGAGKQARGVITKITDGETIVHVDAVEDATDALPRVRVLVPLIKGDRMDTCVEKLVEVGANEVILWPASRAVVRLEGPRLLTRVEHYQGLAQAAARQSGRAAIPIVRAVSSLAEAIAELPAGGARVVLDPGAERTEWPTAADDVTLVSGPEGGLAPAELDALAAVGFASMGLGPRVLRAETAPVGSRRWGSGRACCGRRPRR